MMARMVRKQTYITVDLDKRLKRWARKTNSSEARIIRDALEVYLGGREYREDPLYRVIGIAEGGPADGAEKHDKYIYRRKEHLR